MTYVPKVHFDGQDKFVVESGGELNVKSGAVMRGVAALQYASIAPSAEVENTITETAFDEDYTIAAGSTEVGDVFRIRAVARVIDNNSTDTLTLRLRIAGTDIIATAAVDVADNDVGHFDVLVTVQVVSQTTCTVVASGVQALGVPGTVTAKPFVLAGSTVTNWGTDNPATIDVTAQWSVAHADNEVRLEQLVVEKIAKLAA